MGRVSLVTPNSKGDIVFSLFDFKEGTVSNVIIPGSTEVTTARNLGNWKIESLWKLGQNEKVGGVLLAETVTRALALPADYWGDQVYSDLGSGDLSKTMRAVFAVEPTNLSLSDRLRIGLFSLQAKATSRQEINLADSKYLYRTKLADGTLGYKVRDINLPFELRAILADADISKEGATILLENAAGRDSISGEIGEIVDVLGGKVASVTKLNIADIDCVIFGDSKLVSYQTLAKVFACTRSGKLADYNFDIVLRVGSKFARRF